MTGGDLGLILGIVALIVVAAFLAISETALTRVSRIKVLQMVDEGRKGAERLVKLLEDPPRFLNVILFLLLVVQLAGASLATLLANHITHNYGWIISTFGMTFLIFVLLLALEQSGDVPFLYTTF